MSKLFGKLSVFVASALCAVSLVGTASYAQTQTAVRQTAIGPHFCILNTAYRYTTAPSVIHGTGHCGPTDYSVIQLQLGVGDGHGWVAVMMLHPRPTNLKSGPGLVFIPFNDPHRGDFTFATIPIPPKMVHGHLEAMPNTKLIGFAMFSETGSMGSFANNAFTVKTPVKPPAEHLGITSKLTATGHQNSPFSFRFSAAFGTPPYSWHLASGKLPSGLSLTKGGMLKGVLYSMPGSYKLPMRLFDAKGRLVSFTFVLVVSKEQHAS